MAGMVHVTYDRVRVLRVTSRDQTITGFQHAVCSPEVPIASDETIHPGPFVSSSDVDFNKFQRAIVPRCDGD